jgi:hypothetical protein
MLSAAGVGGRLMMHMTGKVAGASANCLFDSGSEANVISKAFAELQGVSIQPSHGSIESGDGHVVQQVGTSRVFVQFGAFHKAVPCLVMEQLLNGVDFILGDAFMRSQHCILDSGNRRIMLRKGK